MAPMNQPPRSVLIVGSGVFGLSTAWAFAKQPRFDGTNITVVDSAGGTSPSPDGASSDSSRIIRADYADAYYTELAAVAQKEWRKQGDAELGGQGRYSESGFVLMADEPHSGIPAGRKSGMEFTKESWRNVARIADEGGFVSAEKIQKLESGEALREALGTKKKPGDWGYMNQLSGWADATKGMIWLHQQVKATGRVNMVDGHVEELVTEDRRVVGARLKGGKTLKADVVMVAAGAWTGSLIDLRGRTEVTGHPLGYVDVTDEERRALCKYPVALNLSSGLFVIPPCDNVLKVARHSFGYLNPVTISNALPPSPSHERKPFTASQPYTSRNSKFAQEAMHIPPEADRELRDALRDLVPLDVGGKSGGGLETRPWKETRICWYSDTRTGDWLVDWHPGWEGLFVATGDSGHGYKFLPVLGDKVIDCMTGQGGELGRKWRWRADEEAEDGVGREEGGVYRGLITEDGSRGGSPGMILRDEMAKDGKVRENRL